MTAFSNLVAPFSLLTESASYFRKSDSRFTLALLLKMVIKLARFAAFLLPFKALMFAVTGRSLSVAGYSFSGFSVAGIILLLATVVFSIFLMSSRSYVNLTRSVFHSDDDLESAGEEADQSIKPDSDAHSMFGTVSGFFSSVILIAILFTSIVVVVPYMALTVIVYIIYTYYVAVHMNTTWPNLDFDIQNARTVFNFGSMMVTLILIGVLVVMNVPISPIAALFVFIASRQLTGSVTEVVGALYQNRHAIAPRFLRSKLANLDTTNLQVAVRVAPFLTTARQNSWISKTVSQLSDVGTRKVDAKWRKLSARGINMFNLSVEIGDNTSSELLMLFDQRSVIAYKQQVAFQRAFAGNPLLLAPKGAGIIDGYGAVLFSLDGVSELDNSYLKDNLPELVTELWSAPIPENSGLITHSGDHLNWINTDNLDTLSSVASAAQDLDDIRWFEIEFKTLKAKSSTFPSALMVPGLNSDTVMLGSDGKMKIANWSAVDVQPIGCHLAQLLPGWRTFDLEAVLLQVVRSRPDCAGLAVVDLELSASLYRLGKALQRADYAEAIAIISGLRAVLMKASAAD